MQSQIGTLAVLSFPLAAKTLTEHTENIEIKALIRANTFFNFLTSHKAIFLPFARNYITFFFPFQRISRKSLARSAFLCNREFRRNFLLHKKKEAFQKPPPVKTRLRVLHLFSPNLSGSDNLLRSMQYPQYLSAKPDRSGAVLQLPS